MVSWEASPCWRRQRFDACAVTSLSISVNMACSTDILFGKWHQNNFVSRTQVLHQTCNVLILHQEVMYSNTIHLRHELMDGPDLPLLSLFLTCYTQCSRRGVNAGRYPYWSMWTMQVNQGSNAALCLPQGVIRHSFGPLWIRIHYWSPSLPLFWARASQICTISDLICRTEVKYIWQIALSRHICQRPCFTYPHQKWLLICGTCLSYDVLLADSCNWLSSRMYYICVHNIYVYELLLYSCIFVPAAYCSLVFIELVFLWWS